jgi:site-specific DNA-methyltransferase (adenine-specific)
LSKKPSAVLHGDCLELVPALAQSEKFDLIYADPPFNAGGKRAARLGKGERVRGAHAYDDAWSSIDDFLRMLEPRLEVMRAALSERGSLWLHLDHRTVHDAKVAADRVFGRSAFLGEVIWVPGNGGKKRSGPSVTHQTILVYARGKKPIWNGDDPALRESFAATSLRMHFTHVDEAGRSFRERHVAGKTYRYYADEGRRLGSVWTDCPAMRANTPLIAETTGYPTQKPVALLERIVRASSLPGSRVLDPMCGSGTTLVAAKDLGRRFAGVDQSELAVRIARTRLGER